MRKAIVTLALAIVTAGPGLVAPSAQAATAVRAKQVKTTAAFTMPAPGIKPVQGLTLGSGPWTVIAKAFAVDLSGGGDIVRCQIFDVTHNKALDGAAAQVKPDYPGNMITNLAKLVVPAGATVAIQQRCGHDSASGNPAYLDPGATLLAFKAKTAAGNRLARTTAQTPLSPSDYATVTTLSLAAGTWLVGYKATAVSFDNVDDNPAWCMVEDYQAMAYGDVGAAPGMTSVTTLASFLTVTSTGGRTVALRCRNYKGVNSYLDPGSVLWARQVSSAVTASTCGTVTGATTANDLVADTTHAPPSCPVKAGADGSQVGGAAVTPGTWVVLGAEGSLYAANYVTDPGDWVRCAARDVTHNKMIDSAATAWVPGRAAGTTYAGLLQTATRATIEFRCRKDGFRDGSSTEAAHLLLRP